MSAETLEATKEAAPVDMEAFRKMAKYPLVRACDMAPDVREEAVDICMTAVEKHQPDMERITQVGLCMLSSPGFSGLPGS